MAKERVVLVLFMFRSIRPSRVTGHVDMAEIRRSQNQCRKTLLVKRPKKKSIRAALIYMS